MKEPFKIVFEDKHIIVVNKIAKLLIQPSSKDAKPTLTSLLRKHLNQKVYPCHRLDRETTGLIIYAKTLIIQNKIMNQFRSRTVKKRYIAFVRGKLKKKIGKIEGVVLDKEGKRHGETPKRAITEYEVLRTAAGFSVVELIPRTGRTNQLRIQLADTGNPILGERKYAFGRDFKVKFRRLALHAFFIAFTHPITNKRLNFEIELPFDMKTFLQAKDPRPKTQD
ncbi:MAG: RluA family pseudouridine synthase [Candidatus Omnitrophota bacterium]